MYPREGKKAAPRTRKWLRKEGVTNLALLGQAAGVAPAPYALADPCEVVPAADAVVVLLLMRWPGPA